MKTIKGELLLFAVCQVLNGYNLKWTGNVSLNKIK